MNKQQNLTEFWDDFISLEEPGIADENLNEDLDTNLTKAKELLKPYITNHFSTGSYYIDENGIIYDLGNSGYGHAEVSELLNDNGLEIDYKIGKSSRFLKSAGWIRLNTNLNFIELPEERITEEQKRSLLLALDLMLNNVKMDKKVQVNASNQRAEYENCLPEYIIKRIERYYTSGTLYESRWEESDPWDSATKEPENVTELLGKDFLYHATYKPYWEEIQKDGYIRPGKHTNWDDRYKTTRAVYLATDYNNAVYYAKNAENVPEKILKQIVVLKIDANKLDINQLNVDSNQIYDSDNDEGRSIEDPYTWKEVRYYKPIPVSAIVKVYDESVVDEDIKDITDPLEKSFQQQIDEMIGDIKITLYDAKNGHNYAAEYLNDLYASNRKLCAKMLSVIQIFKLGGRSISDKYSKHLIDGIFELRASVATNEARELYFFASGCNEIVITNGFTKKTRKTPANSIEKAKSLRNEYYGSK